MRVKEAFDAGIKFLGVVDRVIGNTRKGFGPEINLLTININKGKERDDERL